MIIGLLALLSAQEHQPKYGIPSEYHGIWDASPSFCNESVSDMRLVVRSEQFSIYRDSFRVHNVSRRDEGSLIVSVSSRPHDDFDNEGFGKPYDLKWKLSNSRSELTMSSGKGATTWHRCPAKEQANDSVVEAEAEDQVGRKR